MLYNLLSISAQKKIGGGKTGGKDFSSKKEKTGGGLEKMKRTEKQKRTRTEAGGNH